MVIAPTQSEKGLCVAGKMAKSTKESNGNQAYQILTFRNSPLPVSNYPSIRFQALMMIVAFRQSISSHLEDKLRTFHKATATRLVWNLLVFGMNKEHTIAQIPNAMLVNLDHGQRRV